MKKYILLILIITTFGTTLYSLEIKKKISFKPYSLDDTYTYKGRVRCFQWDQIGSIIDTISSFLNRNETFGILQNYKNKIGYPPLTKEYIINSYNSVEDNYQTLRHQGIPLYSLFNDESPVRYSRDGSLVSLISKGKEFDIIEHAYIKGIWRVPKQYFHPIKAEKFNKIIFIDKTNQNITAMEFVSTVWHIKSMNPATTGAFKPPYKEETPNGIYVLQNTKPKMFFLRDGTDRIGGFAPYASRFCGGAYIHGIPVNYPRKKFIEYSKTLGTIPLSHMCIRNATSHAKYIYDWGKKNKTLIIIIE